MIELGLSRISQLVTPSAFPWRAIHVAGTNGKGSVCAYISAMLTAGGIHCGRFTSPHLIDRWDCITVHERSVDLPLFLAVEDEVKTLNDNQNIGASEFELLTATAFEIFNRKNVEVGVIEVGMGGRLDATNVLEKIVVSVLTKIGYDHEAFLGHTIEEITRHKAGIMRPGVPCVVDGTNTPEVITTLKTNASNICVEHVVALPDQMAPLIQSFGGTTRWSHLEPHQLSNLSCAKKAVDLAMGQLRPQVDSSALVKHALGVQWPGRLQKLNLKSLIPRDEDALLDGAHNAQSADVLRSFVDRNLRLTGQPVTWVFAASQGKDLKTIFGNLVLDGDSVVTIKFGPVDGMPWVQPAEAVDIQAALASKEVQCHDSGLDLEGGLDWAAKTAAGGPLVIAGSLYLVSDVLRLLRNRSGSAWL